MALPYTESPATKPLGSTGAGGSATPAGPAEEAGPVDAEHEAKVDAFSRMQAAATPEEGADALADFVRMCMRKYGKAS
jgi:hypothetical protein